MLKPLLPVPALLLCLCIVSGTNAHARQWSSATAPERFVMTVAQEGISMREAIQRARKQTGGRVLDAQERGGSYHIKVLTPSGEVRVVRVNARTGQVD